MASFPHLTYLFTPLFPAGHLPSPRLNELLKRYEENPRRFFAPLANEYRKSGDLEQAIALCEQHLREQPGNMNGHVVYGQALFDASQYADAEATFTTALDLDPENLIALRHLGDIARLAGDAPKAIGWYERVLDADPRNSEIQGFIEELKARGAAEAAAGAGTQPAEPEARPSSAVRSDAISDAAPGTPVPAVPSALSDARTIEISAHQPSPFAPTPIAPIQPVAPPRPRVPLLDLDFGARDGSPDHAAVPDAPGPSAPPAPAEEDVAGAADHGVAALGDIEFTDIGSLEPPEPGAIGGLEAPDATADILPPAEGAPPQPLGMETAFGWELPDASSHGLSADVDVPDAPAVEPPAVFVTETMAELYLQQGFRDEALEVYRKLAEQNPDDAALRERIHSLEAGKRASMSFEALADDVPEYAAGTDALIVMKDGAEAQEEGVQAATASETELEFEVEEVAEPAGGIASVPDSITEPQEPTEPVGVQDVDWQAGAAPGAEPRGPSARSVFAALAQRRPLRPDGTLPGGIEAVPAPQPGERARGSLDALYSATPSAADDAMAAALAVAVGISDAAPSVQGRPTQPAGTEFSLDAVFRGEVAVQGGAQQVPRKSQHLKFDQFFAPDGSGQQQAGLAGEDVAPADDAQFQTWLKGLKER
ncbi:MAG: tetratricopeptide repeat protein [Gemmatimonadaceae bacterium]|nr:tetratricopeptide repeat protein [Gemmatimonadaceae bacterium]